MKEEFIRGTRTIHLDGKDGGKGLKAAVESCKGSPAEIILACGDYYLEETIFLDSQFHDLVIRGEDGARLIGGKKLSHWRAVSDPEILNRIDEGVRDKVLVCDLGENGVMEAGEFSRRGFVADYHPSHAELFIDQRPLSISQYPKKGNYLLISGYVKEIVNECEEKIGAPESGFHYDDDRPSKWAPSNDIWMHGYWCWDWANTYEHVTMLDTKTRTVCDAPPHCIRGFKPGQRFFFLNILEEVNTPGDYYIDRQTMKLYFYPEEIQDSSEVLLSMMETPLFQVEGSTNIRLENLSMECVRGRAVYGRDTTGFVVENCLLRNIGNTAVVMEGGRQNAVRNNTIHHCGDGAVKMVGGDRMTLAPANSQIYNNHIYDVICWSRCYYPAVCADGVGVSVTHNMIHDCPYISIWYHGNDIKIEDNEIYSVCLEAGDSGAIYSGRDVTFRGNHVSHNYIHHMGGVGIGTMGIYNDDVLSGTIMEDNYFYEAGRAVMMGGGVDYVVKNNVFVKCYPAINMDSRAAHTEFFWGACYEEQRNKLYHGVQSFLHPNDPDVNLDCTKSPYIDKYPELANLVKVYENGEQLAASAEITRNVFCSKPLFRYYFDPRDANVEHIYDCGVPVTLTDREKSEIFDTRHDVRANWSPGKGDWRFAKNYTASPRDFDDAEWGLISVRPESRAVQFGYQPNDFYTIGLERGTRKKNPPKVLTCLTYPYRGELQKLTLGMRNTEDVPVSFTITLKSTNDQVRLYQDSYEINMRPGEEQFIEVGDINGQEVFCVEARSSTPGVRPSRAENIMGSWSRF